MTVTEKTRENLLRRVAERRGMKLIKSGRRDPQALDFGLYALIDHTTGGAVNPALANRFACSWTLDQVENYLAVRGEKS